MGMQHVSVFVVVDVTELAKEAVLRLLMILS